MSDERVLIYINETKQYTTAKWHLESICGYDSCVAVLDDIADLKPFKMFSNVHIRFGDRCMEAEFYCADDSRLVQRDCCNSDFWAKEESKEIEGNQMLHNVTVTKTEEKALEEYWTIKGIRNLFPPTNDLYVTKEYKKEPTLEDIAQFLSDTKAKSVSVEHNYRFETDLPFC